MTLRVWPPAVPLDPDARVLSAPLAATLAGAGTPVLLLVAGPRAVASGWAPRAAVALAEAWSRDRLRVVLADLSIGAPALNRLVGEPNDEGLADVLYYGASLRRVVRAAATRGFGFIPAGSAPADSRDVLTHEGWRQVVGHFFRDGATLLLYVPADAAGLDALAERLGAVIALAAPGDLGPLDSLLPAEASILALIEPTPAAMTRLASAGPAAPEPKSEATPEAEAKPKPKDKPEAEPKPKPEAKARTRPKTKPEPKPEPELEEPPPEPRARPSAAGRGKSRSRAEVAPEPDRKPRRDPHEVLVDALWARREGAQGLRPRGPLAVDPVPGRKMTEEDLLSEPPPPVREVPKRHRGLRVMLWLLLIVLVVLGGGFAAEQYRLIKLPLLDQWLARLPALVASVRGRAGSPPSPATKTTSAAAGAAAASGAATTAGGADTATAAGATTTAAAAAESSGRRLPAVAVPLPDSLPFSVAVETYRQYATAVQRAAQLRKAQPAIGFFVTPMVGNGASFSYYVMAGPAADSASAAILSRQLVAAGVKTGATRWDLMETRLAFDLGDYDTLAQARRRAAEMARKNIPTYIVEIPFSVGPSRWRVYAGAFQGVADANALRPVLQAAGVPDRLVLRTGIPAR